MVDGGQEDVCAAKALESMMVEVGDQDEQPVFADAGSLKSKTSSRISHRKQHTMRLANDSIFATIAFNVYFQNITLAVICLNAVWIGIDVEYNHVSIPKGQNLEPTSIVVENLFCIYFTIELIVRFLAFRRKRDCIWDKWFVFDGVLVFMMVLETWIMAFVEAVAGSGGGADALSSLSAFRLLRLLRLTRMARLMRSVPELMSLIKGIIAAAKAVFFILLFLLGVMYVFAIIFTTQLGDSDTVNIDKLPSHYFEDGAINMTYVEQLIEAGHISGGIKWEQICGTESDDGGPWARCMFGSMGDSMMSLFTRGVLGDNLEETLQSIKDDSLLLMWFFILFSIIAALTLLNMLIGVLCEVMDASAKEEEISGNLRDLEFCLGQAFESIDKNDDGMINKTEWQQIKDNESVRDKLTTLGVEPGHMEERLDQMQESLFYTRDKDAEGVEKLSFREFVDKMVEVRPDMPAKALDIEMLRVNVEQDDEDFKSRLNQIENTLQRLLAQNNLGGEDNNWAMGSDASEQAFVGRPSVGEPRPSEDKPWCVSSATTDNDWLKSVPMELLVHVLQSRSPPEPGQSKHLTSDSVS